MTELTPHEAPAKDIKALPLMHPGKPVGRDDLLKDIFNDLRSAQPVLLYGLSGAGKTTLAATLAAAYFQQPGGVLWLDARDTGFPGLLVRVGRAYGLTDVITSENPAAMVGMVASTLIQHRPLLVLDNVTDVAAAARFVDKCLDRVPALIISETDADGPWHSVEVDRLDDMSAVVLFKQKASIQGSENDIDIYGVTKLLDYLSLPVVIAARSMFAARQTPDVYLQTLKQVMDVIKSDAANAAVATGYRSLNNALQGLLLMLGATFRGEASAELLSQIGGVPVNALQQPMTILSQLFLVEKFTRYDEDYFRLHPFVHQFARNALKSKNQLATLEQKVLSAVPAYVQQYSSPGAVQPQKLMMEMDNILATARHAATNGNRDLANTLVMMLSGADDFVQQYGYVYELLQLRNTASGSTSAFPAYGPDTPATSPEDMIESYDYSDDYDDYEDYDEDDYNESESIRSYAGTDAADDLFEDVAFDDVEMQEGMSSDALPTDTAALQGIDIDELRRALNQAKQSADVPRQIQILKAIGKVQVGQGKETEAITTYNEILNMCEEQSDDEGTLEMLDMLSALLVRTGNAQAAIMHATRGEQMAASMDDRTTQMHMHMTLGNARQDLGETGAAVQSFSQALEMARQMDDSQHEALALYELGNAYLDDGDTDAAIHAWEQARELFKSQEKRAYEGRVLGGLGTAYGEMGRWSEAIRYHKSAMHIAREVNDRAEEALQLSNLGQAQVEAKELPDALLSYRQALHLAYQSQQRENITSAVVDLVMLMMRSNRLLDICLLLLNDALERDPNDSDLNRLLQQITQKRDQVTAKGISQAGVSGTAQDYAALAYDLLEA